MKMEFSSTRKLFTLATVTLLVALCNVPQTQGFLGRGSMLEGYGDLFGVYCPGFDTTTPVWHHREIVREAVRRLVIDYFQATPPAGRDYNHRYGMTLEEAYQEYYGPEASPKRFLEAVEDLADAAVESESGELGYNPLYHFNNELFSQSNALMQSRWRRLVSTAQTGDVTAARYMLGLSLAALQDFYANSNWVELGNDVIKGNLGLPGSDVTNVAGYEDRTCEDCQQSSQSAGCRSSLSNTVLQQMELTSDYIDGPATSLRIPSGKCRHVRRAVSSSPARAGIGKDLPSSCYSPRHDLHEEAARLATEASAHYLTTLRHALKEPIFLRLLSLSPTPALVVIANVRPSTVQETNAILQALQKLEEQHSAQEYPPEEYLLVPYGGRSKGVYRAATPSNLLTHFRSLTLQPTRSITSQQDPVSAVHMAAHVSPSGAHIYLLAEAGAAVRGTTLLQKTKALLQHKRLVFTPIVVSRTISLWGPRFGTSLKMTDEVPLAGSEYDVTGASDEDTKRLESGTPIDHPSHEVGPTEGDAETIDVESLSSFRQRETKVEAAVAMGGERVSRQVGSSALHQNLEYLSLSTGSHLVDVQYSSLEVFTKLLTVQQYPEAVLYRDVSSSSTRTTPLPLDHHLLKVRVALYGAFTAARLTSPQGVEYSLLDNIINSKQGFSVLIKSPLFSLIEVDVRTLADQQGWGEWSLSYTPRDLYSVSVSVRGVTGLDIAPSFYKADGGSLRPSLQRIQGTPSQDWRNFLDVVVTGIDTSALREVDSVSLVSVGNSRSAGNLRLATHTPRRNSYIRLNTSMPEEPFVVVYTAKDDEGHKLVRQSSEVLFPGSSMLEFSRGREVWGNPGSTLTVPVTLTNTLSRATTFVVDVRDVLNFPITLSRRSLILASNESITLPISIAIPSRYGVPNFNRNQFPTAIQPRSVSSSIRSSKPFSNSLVVTATPSGGGDTSHAVAHLIVAGKVRNRNPAHHQDQNGGSQKKLSKIPVTNNHFAHHYEHIWGDVSSHNSSKRMQTRETHYSNALSAAELNAITNRFQHSKPFNSGNIDSGLRLQAHPDYDLNGRLHPSSRDFEEAQRQAQRDPVLIPRGAQRPSPEGFGGISDRRPATNYLPNHQRGFNSQPLTQDFQEARQVLGSDVYPPTIEETSISSCGGFLNSGVCGDQTWTANIKITDQLGIQTIRTDPASSIPNFIEGALEVNLRYTASCCEPSVTIFATDIRGNSGQTNIGEPRTTAEALGAGGITGIVLGCIALLILIILAVVFVMRRNRGKEEVELRSSRNRNSGQ